MVQGLRKLFFFLDTIIVPTILYTLLTMYIPIAHYCTLVCGMSL